MSVSPPQPAGTHDVAPGKLDEERPGEPCVARTRAAVTRDRGELGGAYSDELDFAVSLRKAELLLVCAMERFRQVVL